MSGFTLKPQKGTVLITVLLFMSFLSIITINFIRDIKINIAQFSNLRDINQSFWISHSIENISKTIIEEAQRLNPSSSILPVIWERGPIIFPFRDGLVSADISDGSNCFNLNGIVKAEEKNKYIRNNDGVLMYSNLLSSLDFSDAEILVMVNSLVDWIDTDTMPGNGGAEDIFYMTAESSYRTPNNLISSISELRAIRGYTEEYFQKIKSFVCVLPNTFHNSINLNTIRPDQTNLLVMLIGKKLNLSVADRIINSRPKEGFRNLDSFWSLNEFNNIEIPNLAKQYVTFKTKFFTLKAKVYLNDSFISISSKLGIKDSGEVYRINKNYGINL